MKEITKPQSFSLTPSTLTEAMEMAKLMANSQMVPKDYQGRPENVLVAVQMGVELGLPAVASLQNIAVINGRPALWGDAVLAIVKSHHAYEWINEYFQDDGTAVCVIKRKGEPEQTRTFSDADAKQANLLGKSGPWSTNPKRMKQMRARAFACRDVFPDALKGLSVAEEAQDIAPPKDITPAPERQTSYQTLTQPSESDLIADINAAADLQSLKALNDRCKEFADSDAVYSAYMAKRESLKAAAKKQQADAPVDPNAILQMIAGCENADDLLQVESLITEHDESTAANLLAVFDEKMNEITNK